MKNFILSIKIENITKTKRDEFILDNFDEFKDAKSFAVWLKEIYEKVKEK